MKKESWNLNLAEMLIWLAKKEEYNDGREKCLEQPCQISLLLWKAYNMLNPTSKNKGNNEVDTNLQGVKEGLMDSANS